MTLLSSIMTYMMRKGEAEEGEREGFSSLLLFVGYLSHLQMKRTLNDPSPPR